MSTINHVNKQEFVYTKGDLDQLLLQCNIIYLNNEIVFLTEEIKEEIQEESSDLLSQALRVLAFAFKQKDQQEI